MFFVFAIILHQPRDHYYRLRRHHFHTHRYENVVHPLAILPVFATSSIWNIIFVISIFLWSDFARYTRAETMSVINENYIKRVHNLGFRDFYIMYKHVLPNIKSTLLVVFCFSVASCILVESSITFLGIGLGIEEVTWGSMLSEGRKSMVWWLILMPGMAIFLVVWSLNTIASYRFIS